MLFGSIPAGYRQQGWRENGRLNGLDRGGGRLARATRTDVVSGCYATVVFFEDVGGGEGGGAVMSCSVVMANDVLTFSFLLGVCAQTNSQRLSVRLSVWCVNTTMRCILPVVPRTRARLSVVVEVGGSVSTRTKITERTCMISSRRHDRRRTLHPPQFLTVTSSVLRKRGSPSIFIASFVYIT